MLNVLKYSFLLLIIFISVSNVKAQLENDTLWDFYNSKWSYLFVKELGLSNGNKEFSYRSKSHDYNGTDIVSSDNDTLTRQRWFSNGVKTTIEMDTNGRFNELFFTDSTEQIVTQVFFHDNEQGSVSSILSLDGKGNLHGGQFYFKENFELQKVLIYTHGKLNGVLPIGIYYGVGAFYYRGTSKDILEKEKEAAINFLSPISNKAKAKENTFIKAIIKNKVKIKPGDYVQILLQENLYINEFIFPKGSFISGLVYLQNNRFQIKIFKLMNDNEIIECNIDTYDTDGYQGLLGKKKKIILSEGKKLILKVNNYSYTPGNL